jgi:hypothetical protein
MVQDYALQAQRQYMLDQQQTFGLLVDAVVLGFVRDWVAAGVEFVKHCLMHACHILYVLAQVYCFYEILLFARFGIRSQMHSAIQIECAEDCYCLLGDLAFVGHLAILMLYNNFEFN